MIHLYETIKTNYANDPEHRRNLVVSYLELARLLCEFGRHAEAAAPYHKALELEEDDPIVNNDLAWFLATSPEPCLRDPAQAVRLATKAVTAKPETANYRNTLGVAFYRKGDDKAAIAELETSMSLQAGGDSFDWFFLAMAHRRLGDCDKARMWFDRAVQWMDRHKPHDEELRRFPRRRKRCSCLPTTPSADSKARAPQRAVAPLIVMRIAVACEQPMGIYTSDINQLQYNMGRHRYPGLVVAPCLNPDVQGIGKELGAVFPVQDFANLSEACGQRGPFITIRAVAFHALSSVRFVVLTLITESGGPEPDTDFFGRRPKELEPHLDRGLLRRSQVLRATVMAGTITRPSAGLSHKGRGRRLTRARSRAYRLAVVSSTAVWLGAGSTTVGLCREVHQISMMLAAGPTRNSA